MTLLLLLAVAFLCYFPCLKGPFLFDDGPSLEGNPFIMTGDWKKAVKSLWRQLLLGSFAVDTYLFARPDDLLAARGAPSSAYHIINVEIHALNGLIVHWILANLGIDPWVAWFGAFLFIVHPLCANAVANIASRGASLSSTFAFLAIGCAVSGHLWAVIPLIVLAILVKEDIGMVFFAISAILLIQGSWKFALVLAILPILAAIYKRKAIFRLFTFNGDSDMMDCGFDPALKHPTYFITAFTHTMLSLPRWMFGIGQSVDHDKPPVTWKNWRFYLALGLAALVGYVFVLVDPLLRIGLILVFVSPLPLYWFFPMPDPIAEHRAYFSVLGMVLILSYIFSFLPLPLWVLICAGYAIQTTLRVICWQSAVALWTSALHGPGRHLRALSNLASAFMQKLEWHPAELYLKQAIEAKPTFSSAWVNLGHVEKNRGTLCAVEANQFVHQAEQLSGEEKAAMLLRVDELRNKAKILWSHSREFFTKATECSPRFMNAWIELGNINEMFSNWGVAEDCYLKALSINPHFEPALNRVGILRIGTGRAAEALDLLQLLVRKRPSIPAYRHTLGMAWWQVKDLDKARICFAGLPPEFQIPQECR